MIKKTLYLFLLLLASSSRGVGQEVMDYSVHANIIYRFTKYVDWPAAKKGIPFTIGIIGESVLFDELKKFTQNKQFEGQPIIIKNYSSTADLSRCHIIFISENESSKIDKIIDATSGKPILIISERKGLINRGVGVNFIVARDRLKLEFNKHNMEDRKLKIASELLALGDNY